MSSFYTKKDQKILDELWTAAFKALDKTATEPVNINDRINSILNNKNQKFSSVSDKVKDMMKRSGFEDFKNGQQVKVSHASEGQKMLSSADIKIFNVAPGMAQTLQNICESGMGLLPITSIIGKLRDIYGNKIVDHDLWTDIKFLSYVTNCNLSCKSNTSDSNNSYDGGNLGKLDTSKYEDPTSADVFAETKVRF